MEEDVQDESEDSTEEEAEDVQEGEETPEEETAATEESAESEETDSEDTEEEIPESEDGEELLSSGIENLSGGTAELKQRSRKKQQSLYRLQNRNYPRVLQRS